MCFFVKPRKQCLWETAFSSSVVQRTQLNLDSQSMWFLLLSVTESMFTPFKTDKAYVSYQKSDHGYIYSTGNMH